LTTNISNFFDYAQGSLSRFMSVMRPYQESDHSRIQSVICGHNLPGPKRSLLSPA
jgi:hypothetical protein